MHSQSHPEGVSDTQILQRLKKAKTAVYELRTLGVFRKGISIQKCIQVYKALIQPRWEYAMHLTPWTQDVQNAIKEVEQTFFKQIFGPLARGKTDRLRLLCRIQTAEQRREILAFKMLRRTVMKEQKYLEDPPESRHTQELQAIRNDIAALENRGPFDEAGKHLETNQSGEALRTEFVTAEGNRLESKRKRKIPYDRPRELPAIIKLPKSKHRQLAVQYAFGRFPQVSTTMMAEKFGNRVRQHMETLDRNLSGYDLEGEEMWATEKALEELLFFSKNIIECMQNDEGLW